MIQRRVERMADFCGRRPRLVALLGLLLAVVSWAYASRLELHTDLLELLPRDSPGFRTFERQLGRLGGGATLLVIIESPDRAANRRFIDDLGARLTDQKRHDELCLQICSGSACQSCPKTLIARVEFGTRDVHDYFQHNRWLYAPESELENADSEVDEAIAKQSGLVEDLEFDSSPKRGPSPQERDGAGDLQHVVERVETRFSSAEAKLNPAPAGYFETSDGASVGLRIVANSTALGDLSGDHLLRQVQQLVEGLNPRTYQEAARVGFAGDIPNSLAERKSLASDAVWATLAALFLVLCGIGLYFRSYASVCIVGLPALIGVGCAYAFAAAAYGYVNSTGAFLGAIILGNGINYPIVLVSRYEEFIAAGQAPADARRTAVWNAFRAELVGAAVASIAYGSLTVTRFRGFSQFGAIGCVGMLFVWGATILLVPALLAIRQRFLRSSTPISPARSRSRASGRFGLGLAHFGLRYRLPIVLIASVTFIGLLATLPGFLADPWEYNFDRLGSRGSKSGGPATWSIKAERVFGGKSNVGGASMLADSAEQALRIKREILRKDQADPRGRLIHDVTVVQDFLPGSSLEQERKLALIARIRARFTPRVLASLSPSVRTSVEALLPPMGLRVLSAADLPTLVRSQFEDRAGKIGSVFYVRYRDNVVLSDGRNLLRMAALTDDLDLADGTKAQTASRATIFAEMIRSMRRDGPLASLCALCAVTLVVLLATREALGMFVVLGALLFGVVCMLGLAAITEDRLNFLNFIAIPITLGIGCEYPFNVFDRSRLLHGDVSGAVSRAGMAVLLCSYTTVIGYGSLLFADSQALQSFGRLAISGEIACVVGALLLLPAVLHIVRRRRRAEPTEPATSASD
ncbi:MAG: MMPL family transporter [Pseudomonadota bacterium]